MSLEDKIKKIREKLDQVNIQKVEENTTKHLVQYKGNVLKSLSKFVDEASESELVSKLGDKKNILKDISKMLHTVSEPEFRKSVQDKIESTIRLKLNDFNLPGGTQNAQNLYEIFQSFFDFDSLWIIDKPIIGQEHNFLDFGFESGAEANSFFNIIKILLDKMKSIERDKIDSGKIVYSPDATQEMDEFGVFYNNFKYKSVLILPVSQASQETEPGKINLFSTSYQAIGLNSKKTHAFSEKDIQFMYTIVNLFFSRESMTEMLKFSSNFLVSILYNMPLGMLGITPKNDVMIINNTVHDLLKLQSSSQPDTEEKTREIDTKNYSIKKLFPKADENGLSQSITDIRDRKIKEADLQFWYDLPNSKKIFMRALLFSLVSNNPQTDSSKGEQDLELYMLIEDITKQYEQLKMQEELEVARNVQVTFLPKENFKSDDVETFGVSYPAKEVGGDYYDFIPHEDDLNIAIADVSGKGLAAAIVMSSLKSAFQAFIDIKADFLRIIPSLNNIAHQNLPQNMFITAFYGRLNMETNEFTYCNAGHNYPLLIREDGEIVELKTGGIILGIFPDATYEIGKLTLDKNDIILAYTDGITEAINIHEEEFGEARLMKIIKEIKNPTPQKLIERIIQAVKQFQGNADQYDDMTLFAIKVIGKD